MALRPFSIPTTADDLLQGESDWRDDLELHRGSACEALDGMPICLYICAVDYMHRSC
jgi:hypothetical protein